MNDGDNTVAEDTDDEELAKLIVELVIEWVDWSTPEGEERIGKALSRASEMWEVTRKAME